MSDEQGIKIALAGLPEDQWVLYHKDGWTSDIEYWFTYATAIDSIEMVVERTLDWRVMNAEGAWIPFDKDKFLQIIQRIKSFERVPFLSLPLQTQQAINLSFWAAIREARKLPFPAKLPAG